MSSGYNYFRYAGARKLLQLLGIPPEEATEEQVKLAEGFMNDMLGYARSVIGH
jgi:hypothetical protein